MKRYNLSIRRPTHIGRLIYNKIYYELDKFINNLIRSKINFKFTKDHIGNMDEIQFQFNKAPLNIIDQKSKKSIIIKTYNQEKLIISALLCILADGTNLPPYLIFKGKNASPILSKELNPSEYVIKKSFLCI